MTPCGVVGELRDVPSHLSADGKREKTDSKERQSEKTTANGIPYRYIRRADGIAEVKLPFGTGYFHHATLVLLDETDERAITARIQQQQREFESLQIRGAAVLAALTVRSQQLLKEEERKLLRLNIELLQYQAQRYESKLSQLQRMEAYLVQQKQALDTGFARLQKERDRLLRLAQAVRQQDQDAVGDLTNSLGLGGVETSTTCPLGSSVAPMALE